MDIETEKAPYKDFKTAQKDTWNKNPFINNRLFLGQDTIGLAADAVKSAIWGVFQWGNRKHEKENVRWTKTALTVLLLITSVHISDGTQTTDLQLYRIENVGDDYLIQIPANMDILEASIPDKREGKTVIFKSSVSFEGPLNLSTSAAAAINFQEVNVASITANFVFYKTDSMCFKTSVSTSAIMSFENVSCP